jgi:acetyl-CoA carboxylase biotin carboxylase subunit
MPTQAHQEEGNESELNVVRQDQQPEQRVDHATSAEETVVIPAPTAGLFYAQSEPGAPPYVKVGDHVQEDTTVVGNKLVARSLARKYGIPVLPGSEKISTYQEAERIVDEIGLPVMLKAAAGGGGRGMKIVHEKKELATIFDAARAEAQASFGDGTLYVERYIPRARHIEVQILGDKQGNVIHLGERDCSLQRRHQKLVEEALAPAITDQLREEIRRAAVRLAQSIGYENAGTVEFIVDQDTGSFYFLEMNTRIQVEHPVTEVITGIDLVEEQFRIASGHPLSFRQSEISFSGHAIECRINAESPVRGFYPSPGRIVSWQPPQGPGVRIDSHCYAGYTIPVYYDSLMAKLIVSGRDRKHAIERLKGALDEFKVDGVETTLPFLKRIIHDEQFQEGQVHTRFLEPFLQSNE